MRGVAQALVIMLVAGILAVLSAAVRPSRVVETGPGQISVADALLTGETVLWLDARTEEEYRKDHWAGAMMLNEDTWDELIEPVLERWSPGMKIIVYCSSAGCRRSEEVARRLREEVGLENVWSLVGGWEAMEKKR